MQQKVTRIGKGAAFAAVAGAFALFMLIYLLEGLAWLANDLLNVTSGIWIGFFIVTAGLLIFGALCAVLAVRFFKKGAPPTPQLAIEEAKKTREVLAEEMHR
jgi:apolipoprotein N-acyltransferase